MRVITQADGVLLEMIAVTYVRWKDAEAVLERDGLTFTSKTGYIGPRPEVAIARRAMQLLRQLIPEIGMTPSSRPGLVAAAHDDHVNAFDKFAKGPERPTC